MTRLSSTSLTHSLPLTSNLKVEKASQ